jgi:hypothetical protein
MTIEAVAQEELEAFACPADVAALRENYPDCT